MNKNGLRLIVNDNPIEARDLRMERHLKARESRQFFNRLGWELGYNPKNIGTYNRKDNTYSSKRFEFNLNTCKAWSYDWWLFVVRVGNTIYFNDISYSMQTSQHQEMAMNILKMADYEAHGLKLVKVYIKSGLQNIPGEIEKIRDQIQEIKMALINPRSKKSKRQDRLNRIKELEKQINELKELNKIIKG